MTEINPEQCSSEHSLVLRIQRGESAAFKELFFTYCQALIRFANRFVNDTALAEDIVQDVYLKIWSNRQHLNPKLGIKSYLYVAVKNQALKELRHQQIRRKANEERHFLPPRIPTPEESLKSREIETTVLRAVEELPDKCRLIFSMNRFDGLSYSEIAEILDLSVKTVETQMGRALKFLRKRLKQCLQVVTML